MNKKKILLVAAIVTPILMVVFSGSRTNPEVVRQIQWDSPKTKALFYRACADCHSHETKWPWYTYFAPVSWWVIDHVDEGRDAFNISAKDLGEAEEAASVVEEGEMPLPDYLRAHPEAILSAEEKAALIDGLDKTFESQGGKEDDDEDDDDDEKKGEREHEEGEGSEKKDHD
jgi:Haem-binding domain